VLLAVLTMLLALLPAGAVGAKQDKPPKVDFTLTVLHNNDGESQVVDAGGGLEDFGGAARFKTLVDDLKWSATHGKPAKPGSKRGVVMISSGDNFLAGPEFNAGLQNGIPFYDTIAMELIGYDAINLGNHDFDFGPDVLADFIAGFMDPPPYVSANLDFSDEPRLQAYVDAGVIVPATVVKERGELIGVIGLETPNIPFISSPRNVVVSDDLIGVVQGEIDKLEGMGVNKIILSSHLQSIDNELALACDVDGLDVVIAGGGDELLANAGDLLMPGDDALVFGNYPQVADCDVPVVTTSGAYRYVGRLVVEFDKAGNVMNYEGGPVRVSGGTCNGTLPCDDAVEPDPMMQALVTNPVVAALDVLATNVIGTSEVDLNGVRSPGIRTEETNEGNLIADALRWQATELVASFEVAVPDVALLNGGGIRNDSVIPAGDITELDTFDMVPFSNFVSVLESFPRTQFKEILENAVSRTQPGDTPGGTGRFAQISGFSFTYDPAGTAQVLDVDGNVVVPGTRIVNVTLDDTTAIVTLGAVQPGADLTIATIDFLARGGDEYPYRGALFTNIGVTYQQALANYIVDGLGGLISAADYPEGGEGRIIELP
jgi:5'-nucleotidase